MKIVAISDMHNGYKNLLLPKADMLIIAGDIDIYKDIADLRYFNWWLGSLDYKYKIVIAGNHDCYLESLGVKTIQENLGNCIYLENTSITVEGIKIYGSPISPKFGNWSFMKERGEEINKFWANIPEDTDILVTHSPPYGILDSVPFSYSNNHVGCSDLLETVMRIKPKYHIFGHIHNAYGQEEKNKIKFINCSICDEDYAPINKPVIFKI